VLHTRDTALRCALLALLGGALCAFCWPGRTARLVAELRAAEEARERADLVRLLGESGDPQAREALLESTRDREAGVRAEAVLALARLEPPAGAGHDPTEPRAQSEDGTHEVVAALLSDNAPRVRAAAAEALGRLAVRAADSDVDLLLRSLSDEDPKVRVASARALGGLRAARAVAALGRSLSDPSLEVAIAAAHALAQAGGSQAFGLLASRLGQAPPELRVTILDAVPRGSATLAHKLARLALSDENGEVVLAGLRLVVRQQLDVALEQVEALAHMEDSRVAAAARGAAHTLRALRGERQAQPPARPAWLEPLLRAGEPALPAEQAETTLSALEASLPPGEPLLAEPLAEWLLRAPHGLRARIAALLASTGAPARAGALRGLISNADPALQIALCDVFAHTRDARHAPALAPLLRAHDAKVRAAAARALGAIADLRTLDDLRELLEQGPARTRADAAYALALALERLRGELGRRAARRLHRTLVHTLLAGDEPSAARAACALGLLSPYATSQALRQYAPRLSRTREQALLRASARDGSRSARALRAMYRARPEAALAATALTGQLLTDAPSPDELLRLSVDARWPLGPIAAFGLARAAPSALRALDTRALCAATRRSAEPTTTRNLRVTLERLQVTCADLPRETIAFDAPEGAPADGFQSLVFADGSTLISAPDAAHDASWPALRHRSVADPWQYPYGSKR
jgi:HEAT repeat protein